MTTLLLSSFSHVSQLAKELDTLLWGLLLVYKQENMVACRINKEDAPGWVFEYSRGFATNVLRYLIMSFAYWLSSTSQLLMLDQKRRTCWVITQRTHPSWALSLASSFLPSLDKALLTQGSHTDQENTDQRGKFPKMRASKHLINEYIFQMARSLLGGELACLG